MKEKIKTLKIKIDKYLPQLQKRYPMSELISNSIGIFLLKDMDEHLLESWYHAQGEFIEDIEKEIEVIEEPNFTFEKIQDFKRDMDKYYDSLLEKHSDFFLMIYRFVSLVLERDKLCDELKESYKNIYSSVVILKEDIERFESRR